MMKSWANAACAAASISASVASGRTMPMLLRMVSENRKVSWLTYEMLPRNEAVETPARSWPSIRTEPLSGT